MRLFFLAHRIPYPPNKGDKIRSFHELRGLAERGHEVHLLAFADDPQDRQPGYQAALSEFCSSVTIVPLTRGLATLKGLACLSSRRPLSVGYYASRTMRRLVRQTVARVEPEVLVVYSSQMVQYVPPALTSRTVVDLVDVDSEKWRDYARSTGGPRRWIYSLEAHRLHAYERDIVGRFAHTVVTTEREKALLAAPADVHVDTRVHALKNGVDWQRFRPDAFEQSVQALPERVRRMLPERDDPLLVFTGAMNYHANADGVSYFVDQVLPLVHASEPTAQFLIVGSNPAPSVQRLGDKAGVIVTGSVEDVRPFLAAATVCVVPLRIARGIQNKVLEAMAMGRAVVTTPIAIAGLTVVPGRDVMVGRSPEELAGTILRLIRDDRLRQSLGDNARRFVLKEHDWRPMLRRFAELAESVASPRSPERPIAMQWHPIAEKSPQP